MIPSSLIKSIIFFILSVGITFILLLAYGRFTAELLLMIGIFGFAGYIILDSPIKFTINKVLKYIVAISISSVQRTYDLNNYQVDTRQFEYIDLGRLVKHEPEVKVFKFIDFNDLFLIVFITTVMIQIYLILKYYLNRNIKNY
jgi:hypothetical protein